jgi:hypothetical protein
VAEAGQARQRAAAVVTLSSRPAVAWVLLLLQQAAGEVPMPGLATRLAAAVPMPGLATRLAAAARVWALAQGELAAPS